MYEAFGLFIDGSWRSGGHARLDVIDPATGGVLCHVPGAGRADVGEAIAAVATGLEA